MLSETQPCIFLCAGRAGFPENFQIFREIFQSFLREIFAQDLRHLDAGLAIYLALERTPTRTRAATKFCASRNHAGRVHATFARAARRKISGTLQFFRASWAEIKICVIPTRDAFLFEYECNTDSINSQRRCEVCAAHAGRVHAIFLCAGRSGIPENFQIYRAISAQDFKCVISTLDSRFILQ